MIVKSLLPACAAAALIATPILFAAQARAEDKAPERIWRHGLSLFGDLKYPPDFKHFDYVNPNAPTGGTERELALGTFDNFNPVVAGVKGTLASGIVPFGPGPLFNSLATSALDEIATHVPSRSGFDLGFSGEPQRIGRTDNDRAQVAIAAVSAAHTRAGWLQAWRLARISTPGR